MEPGCRPFVASIGRGRQRGPNLGSVGPPPRSCTVWMINVCILCSLHTRRVERIKKNEETSIRIFVWNGRCCEVDSGQQVQQPAIYEDTYEASSVPFPPLLSGRQTIGNDLTSHQSARKGQKQF